VDTAPFVYFLGGHGPRDSVVEELLARAAAADLEAVASVVTEAELLVGALRAGPREAALVGQLFDGPAVRVVPVSRQVARRAAEIRAAHGLRMVDAIVAATALEEGCTALLGNDRALRRLEGRIAYLHLDDVVDGAQEGGPSRSG
jgi:predicted nucleic acid-binding protein